MKTIYKYPLKLVDTQRIKIPKGSVVISAQVQDGVICLWAEVDTDKPLVEPLVYVVGTGQPLPEQECWFDGDEQHFNLYIDTVQLNGFVWHIYVEI